MKRIIALMLLAVLLLGTSGCGETTKDSTPSIPAATTVPTDPQPSAAELYTQAAKALEDMTQVTLEISRSTELSVGGETYQESAQQTLVLLGLGTDGFTASLEESMTCGSQRVSVQETFVDGSVYAVTDGFQYTASLDQDEYIARFAPASLLTPSLYGSVEAQDDGLILFSAPTALEDWLALDSAQLIDASGSAVLDSTGTLTESTYTATYQNGAAEFTTTVGVHISTEVPQEEITVPSDAADYISLESLDTPRIIGKAYGYLLQSQSVTFTSSMTIISQAAAAMQGQQINMQMHGSGADKMACIDNSVYFIDYSQGAETSESTLNELYRDGKYTVSADGGDSTEELGVTSAMMDAYCQELLITDFSPLSNMSSIHISDLGSVYLIEYSYTEDAAKELCGNVCSFMFQDADLLNNLASSYQTNTAEGYFAVDKYTNLLTATGLQYEGVHTIEGGDYLLSLQLDDSYYLASLTAYEEITEEPLPSAEPETRPTPLFYHVTGPEGQEMWLLGTIHVGDARTGYLPQEIYDAFQASDALAVEFDTEAFADQAEKDEELQSILAEAYFYADGTTAEDHISDSALYDTAVQLMKASGNYNFNVPYAKPSLWSQSIENFFLQQGYNLTTQRGVDTQLLKLAQEQDKDILDIESAEFQIQMITGYSDALQEELLSSSVQTDALEYIDSVHDLYEKWCLGDEATLREALQEDTSDLTEEELVLYEEYNNAMLKERNAGMLEVAKSYLESGDTIFYAVGLAHLLADDGLVFTLQDAGYTVELVSYK